MLRQRSDPLPVDQVRDLLGVVRVLYATFQRNGYAGYLPELKRAGIELRHALELAARHPPGSSGHFKAWETAERATARIGRAVPIGFGLLEALETGVARVRWIRVPPRGGRSEALEARRRRG